MSKIATELQCYFIGMKGIRPTSTQNKCATYQKAKEYGCTIVNYTPKDNQLIMMVFPVSRINIVQCFQHAL